MTVGNFKSIGSSGGSVHLRQWRHLEPCARDGATRVPMRDQTFFFERLSPREIHQTLVRVHGDNAPSYGMVKKWMALFKNGNFSTPDAPRSGRPKSASTDEMAEKMRETILLDRRIPVREISAACNVGLASVSKILHQQLHARKVRGKWMPRNLSDEQKAERVKLSCENLAMLEANPTDFWRRYVTVDETWIRHYTPEDPEATRE